MAVYALENKLLAILKANRNRYLDEESLYRDYGLVEYLDEATETAQNLENVVEVLRLQGYEIDGDPLSGWRLISIPDVLNYLEIESGLETTFLGRSLFTYRIIGSTNDTARSLAAGGAPDGSLLVAEEQTDGRGRFTNRWYSPPKKGILASLILRPGLQPRQVGCLGLLAAFSICLAVEEQTGLKPQIKWPNDVYLGSRKVGGILCESALDGEKLKYVILGFGINVNTNNFPDDIEKHATSIFLENGQRTVNRVELLQRVLYILEETYFKFLAQGFSFCLPRVQVRDFLKGRHVTVSLSEMEKISGFARGIDENGALLLESENMGTVKSVLSGTVVSFAG